MEARRTHGLGGRETILFAVMLFLALGQAACASAPSSEGPAVEVTAERSGETDAVLLTVDNQNFRDATIYMHWNGTRRQVGIVDGKTKRTFELEWYSHRVVFEVDLLAGRRYRSYAMDARRGDHLKLIIGSN